MDYNAYISKINSPQDIQIEDISLLKNIIEKYPYFQSARALYLKALHLQRSFAYNKELKITAAYTTDRDVLFEYIVSDDFVAYKSLNILEIPVIEEELTEIKKAEPTLDETIEKSVLNTLVYIEDPSKETELIQKIDHLAQKKAEAKTITDESSAKQNDIAEKISIIEEQLAIGEPLDFDKNEKYSFNEWLKLTKLQKITREEKLPETDSENLSSEKTSIESNNDGNNIDSKKKKKLEIIDRFIETNPKITPVKNATIPAPIINQTEENQGYFMTETLAKIYLEQKKYQKAIQAYEILILKYPEKSSLFADRISYIKELQQYHNL